MLLVECSTPKAFIEFKMCLRAFEILSKGVKSANLTTTGIGGEWKSRASKRVVKISLTENQQVATVLGYDVYL